MESNGNNMSELQAGDTVKMLNNPNDLRYYVYEVIGDPVISFKGVDEKSGVHIFSSWRDEQGQCLYEVTAKAEVRAV
jgi:hypothetical protein